MSMTTAKETAFAYSGVRRQRGIVFEITAGRVDVGASIQFLSQYPGEAEFLTQPLCCLEVGAPTEATVTLWQSLPKGCLGFRLAPPVAFSPFSEGRIRAFGCENTGVMGEWRR